MPTHLCTRTLQGVAWFLHVANKRLLACAASCNSMGLFLDLDFILLRVEGYEGIEFLMCIGSLTTCIALADYLAFYLYHDMYR